MAASLSVVGGLVQIRSHSSIVLLHGTEDLPVADQDNPIGDNKGAIEPSVETIMADGFIIRLQHTRKPGQKKKTARDRTREIALTNRATNHTMEIMSTVRFLVKILL